MNTFIRTALVYAIVVWVTPTVANAMFPGTGIQSDGDEFLLVYPNLTDAELDFDMGKKRIAFTIRYADSINPKSFSAPLNSKDITNVFHPRADRQEEVYLRLKPGSNTLVLKVSDHGDTANTRLPYWDVDEFHITLQGPEPTGKLIKGAAPAFGHEFHRPSNRGPGKAGKPSIIVVPR